MKIKLNKKKIEEFQELISIMIEDGKNDIYLTDNQTKLYIYPKCEDYTSIVLDINGNWNLE